MMSDCRYQMRLGVRGEKALDLLRGLAHSACTHRAASTWHMAPGDLWRDEDGEVMYDLSRKLWLDFSPRIRRPLRSDDFTVIDAEKARVLNSVAEMLLQTVGNLAMRDSIPDGFLQECHCLIDALKGATRESLVEAYGEGVTQAVYGAWVDPLAVAIAESIRRHIVLRAERRDEERRAMNERHSTEMAEMDARQHGEIAEAAASRRRLFSAS